MTAARKVQVRVPGSAHQVSKPQEQIPKPTNGQSYGQGFLACCIGIITQDIRDRFHDDRKRKREEYERFCELARGGKRD